MFSKKGWKRRIITSSIEIELILKRGKRIETRWFRLILDPTDRGMERFVIIVSRRFGKAVERNRIKRRLRQILRKDVAIMSRSADMVIIPKPASLNEDFSVLQKAIHKTITDTLV
ncbi:MAG: ribonuclease P protein component [Nitrospiria bacterium]